MSERVGGEWVGGWVAWKQNDFQLGRHRTKGYLVTSLQLDYVLQYCRSLEKKSFCNITAKRGRAYKTFAAILMRLRAYARFQFSPFVWDAVVVDVMFEIFQLGTVLDMCDFAGVKVENGRSFVSWFFDSVHFFKYCIKTILVWKGKSDNKYENKYDRSLFIENMAWFYFIIFLCSWHII